ncbi:hypothetical protein CDD81_3677 [Ophiocordyceps australis]|uniref:Uncharacterized protein n=1 Tax=Ophiocordyceps australis TaxID=1399860 RepID=A0A2C5XX19_9HYPO|nr:hypothetical protein CDD81_3677 [Ophiocordyceps australis]
MPLLAQGQSQALHTESQSEKPAAASAVTDTDRKRRNQDNKAPLGQAGRPGAADADAGAADAGAADAGADDADADAHVLLVQRFPIRRTTTPLSICCKQGNETMIRLLRHGVPPLLPKVLSRLFRVAWPWLA